MYDDQFHQIINTKDKYISENFADRAEKWNRFHIDERYRLL